MIAVKATDVVEAMEERFSEFIVRGGNMREVVALRDIYYRRMGNIYSLSYDDMYRLKITHRVCGGVSERADASKKNIVKFEMRNSYVHERFDISEGSEGNSIVMKYLFVINGIRTGSDAVSVMTY